MRMNTKLSITPSLNRIKAYKNENNGEVLKLEDLLLLSKWLSNLQAKFGSEKGY
jgi:hypothetical protein